MNGTGILFITAVTLGTLTIVFTTISLVFRSSKNRILSMMNTEGMLMSQKRVTMSYHFPIKHRITLVDLYLSHKTLAAFQPFFNIRNLCLPLDRAATPEAHNTRIALEHDKNGKAFLKLYTEAMGRGEMRLHPDRAEEWFAIIRENAPQAVVE